MTKTHAILIAEDDTVDSAHLKEFITRQFPNVTVDVASSITGMKDMLASRRGSYDVVMMDSHMPQSPGDQIEISTAAYWQLAHVYPNACFVLMSAYGSDPQIMSLKDRIEAQGDTQSAYRRFFLVEKLGSFQNNILSIIRSRIDGSEIWTPKSVQAALYVTSKFEELLIRGAVTADVLYSLQAREFEELVASLWERLDYKVELTKRTRDGGRDVIAVKNNEANLRILIECKRFAPDRRVGVQLVRALYGVKVDEGATKAILATTSSFSQPALNFFEAHPWELEARDRDGVLEWIELAKKL